MSRISLGNRLRKRRKELGYTQKEVAERAGISISYLNLIENNRRYIAGGKLQNIATALKISVNQLTGTADVRLLQDLAEIAKDPLLSQIDLEENAPQDLVGSFPQWSKGIVGLYNAYQSTRDTLNNLSEVLPRDMLPEDTTNRMVSLITSIRSFSEILAEEDLGEMDRERFSKRVAGESRQLGEIAKSLMDLLDIAGTEAAQPSFIGEIEDFLVDRENYFPKLEEGAEKLRTSLENRDQTLESALVDYIEKNLGLTLSYSRNFSSVTETNTNRYQHIKATNRLILNEKLPPETIRFQLTRFVAEYALHEEILETIESVGFTSAEAQEIALQAMSRYAAGAILFPYDRFYEYAENSRYDIQVLQHHFGGSFEQICHRLVTLKKPDAKGVPFAFLRSDIAGNLSKRFNLPNLRIPKYGSACPLWAIYRSFISPGEITNQLVKMPDQQMFLFIASTVKKSTESYGTPDQIYSIQIACDSAYIDKIIYGDSYNPAKETFITDAGISCKLCPRTNCSHRAQALIHPLTKSQEQE